MNLVPDMKKPCSTVKHMIRTHCETDNPFKSYDLDEYTIMP